MSRKAFVLYVKRHWLSIVLVGCAAGAVAVPVGVGLYWLLGVATQTSLLDGLRFIAAWWLALAGVGWLVQALVRLRARWQVTAASLAIAGLWLCVALPVGTWYRYAVDHTPRGSEYASVAVQGLILDSKLSGPWGSDAKISRVTCAGAEQDLRAHIDKLVKALQGSVGREMRFEQVVMWAGVTESPVDGGVVVSQPLGLEWSYTDSRGTPGTMSMSGGVWRFDVIEVDDRWQVCGLTSPQLCWRQDGTDCFVPEMSTGKKRSWRLPFS